MHKARGIHCYNEARHPVRRQVRALPCQLSGKFSLAIRLAMVASILMAAIIWGGCSSSSVSQGESVVSSASPVANSFAHMPTNGLVQSNTGGSVTIDIEWLGTVNGLLTFAVAMNTHSVDLDGYDLGKLATLRDDMAREYYPVSWESDTGRHHRHGTLAFPLPDSLNQDEAKYFTLTIRDVAGVSERVLQWELK